LRSLGEEGDNVKIVRVESFARPEVALVRLTTDSGDWGWGQIATTEAADIVAQTLHRQVAPVVLGRDPEEPEAIGQAVLEATLKFPGSYICRALASVDTAMLDLRARRAGVPVCQLLGGRPDPVPVYGSSMSRAITPTDEAARMVRLRDDQGFRAFKIRAGTTAGHNQDPWPGRTRELIPTVRRSLGDEVVIHADANSCYTPDKAVEIGRMLEDQRFGHFEEPCPYWELDWTRVVTEKLRIPVAGGEQDNYMPVWRQIIREHVVDIVQPDICYIGGFTRALQVARMAAEYGLPCTPHSANHSLVTVFTLHLRNVMPNPGPFMEFSIEDQSLYRPMYSPILEVKDGVVVLPSEGPGWGVTIREEWLAGSEYRKSEAE
jgi:L-alanine-DL-glutamate epimerase-like enolase superfamily enzyme